MEHFRGGNNLRIGYGLRLEQTQKLIMTPELRQAITILQLSALELSTFVDQQLLENPLLEVVEDSAAQTLKKKMNRDNLSNELTQTVPGTWTGRNIFRDKKNG